MANPTRKFSLLDAMVFVAATAAGLGIMKSMADVSYMSRQVSVGIQYEWGSSTRPASLDTFMQHNETHRYPPWWMGQLIYWSQRVAFWPGPLLAAWSLATFGLNFRLGRRIAQRPGTAAGLAVLLALAATAMLSPQLLIEHSLPDRSLLLEWSFWWPGYWLALPRSAAFGVVVTWAMLASGGRWAPVSDWHDRLGRALGASWIGMAAAGIASEWLLSLVR